MVKLDTNIGVRRLLLFIVVASTACGDSTEPQADVSGSWTYSATYAVDLGFLGTTNCSGSGVQATVTQTGSSFSGSVQGGDWTCDVPSFDLVPFTSDNPGQVSGTVEGTSVSFEVQGFVLLMHEGTLSGNSMSGTLTGTGSIPGLGSVSLTGTWSASR